MCAKLPQKHALAKPIRLACRSAIYIVCYSSIYFTNFKIYVYAGKIKKMVAAIKVKSLYESATHNCKQLILISLGLAINYVMCWYKNSGTMHQSTISSLEQRRYNGSNIAINCTQTLNWEISLAKTTSI